MECPAIGKLVFLLFIASLFASMLDTWLSYSVQPVKEIKTRLENGTLLPDQPQPKTQLGQELIEYARLPARLAAAILSIFTSPLGLAALAGATLIYYAINCR